ncbi:MAG TPA: RpiB/LacA/LacB family sugar-phosphate isomerase [Candidatus Rubrimentiphilum sp.]|nr:RpiB/LacA/LacB family sugar-phosphate isomerase [Candidatus Rubrimentiphilum sp.]
MRIALGSDEATELTAALERDLRERGHDPILFGALQPGEDDAWPGVAKRVGTAVASGECDYGVVCCWSGTGVSIAANKVPGVRAALCNDPQTATLAREWNDANVLALSLRNTAIPVAKAMLDAWFSTGPTTDPKYRAMIAET